MRLLERIEKDYLAAYKAKEAIQVAVLRMLKAAIKNRQIELQRPLEDDEILAVLSTQAKQRKESIQQYEAAGREELAQREAQELVIIEGYLPAKLSPEELAAAVEAVVAETGATSMKDMGRVMQALMAAHKGAVDGQQASALVKQRLSG